MILILPFLPALRAIALTSLRKVRFEYGDFFSLSSFSPAIFLNFQQCSVTWMSVLQCVQYIGTDSVFVFLPLFVKLFLDFANLFFFLLVWSLSLPSRSLAGGVSFCSTRSHSLINLACTMPKRQAVAILPEADYELTLVMENVKRESWRRSTSSPKIGILVLIMHMAWSPNTNS
jgi:hypothetical protein